MKEVTNDVVGVDVYQYDLNSSILEEVVTTLYGEHSSMRFAIDSMNLQFGSAYSAKMLRFHARSSTMCEPLYNHLTELVSKDTRPICVVLYQFMKINGAETADLVTCLRLLLEFDYVQMQVVEKHVNKLLLRTQQLLNVKSTDQVKKFVDEYNLYPTRKVIRKAFMEHAGAYLSRARSSGLPSGHLF